MVATTVHKIWRAHRTKIKAACSILAIYAAFYRCWLVERPQLFLRATAKTKKLLAKWQIGMYWPTPWALSAHVQIALFLVRSKMSRFLKLFSPLPSHFLPVQTAHVPFPDGETGQLEYIFPRDATSSPPSPVVLFLPGITSSSTSDSVWSFMHACAQRGWGSVVFHRRGHCSAPLKHSRDKDNKRVYFNIMGCTHDLRVAIARLRELMKSHGMDERTPLCIVGISAGSGLVVRFLGEEGAAAKTGPSAVAASAALYPGYDISTAFSKVHPWYSGVLISSIRKFFTEPNKMALIAAYGQPLYERVASVTATRSIDDFIVRFANVILSLDW